MVLWPVVLISHNYGNWGAQCDAELGTRLNFYPVFLITRDNQRTLARTPSGHLWLYVVFRELHPWRNPVRDTSNRFEMRFSISIIHVSFNPIGDLTEGIYT